MIVVEILSAIVIGVAAINLVLAFLPVDELLRKISRSRTK